VAPTVNYRTYPAALNAKGIELLADVDEYFPDVIESLKGVDDPQLFMTAWILKPGIMLSRTVSFRDLVLEAVRKPNGVCRILVNTNAPAQSPGVLKKMATDFRAFVAKGLPAGTSIDGKLKIILSANLAETLNAFFEHFIDAERVRRAPKPPPSATMKSHYQQMIDAYFPGKPALANTLDDLAIASHHQKTITILGKKNNQPVLVSWCGGIDVSSGPAGQASKTGVHNGGTWWHDFAMRARGDAAMGTLQNFVDRWNAEIGRLADITAFGVTASDTLEDADDLFDETDDELGDDVETDLTEPGTISTTAIRSRYESMIGAATSRIIIINQYVRHRELAAKLKDALDSEPGLTITIIIPAYPEEVAREDLPRLRELFARAATEAERGPLRAQLAAKANSIDPVNKLSLLLQNRCLKDLVVHPRVRIWLPSKVEGSGAKLKVTGVPYRHAKMMICDDNTITVGSANFNGRSMDGDTDTEINLTFRRAPGSHAGEPDVKTLREDARFEWHKPEPADENDATRYPNSYFARHNLRRYGARHWEADSILTAFPTGRAAFVDYMLQFQDSPFVDKLLTKKLTRTEAEAKLASVPLINFDDPAYVEKMLELFENLL